MIRNQPPGDHRPYSPFLESGGAGSIPHIVELDLQPDLGSPRQARESIRTLAADDIRAAEAILVVSELVTNAVRYSDPPDSHIHVRGSIVGDVTLLVAVTNAGSLSDAARAADKRSGGWGLQIVEALVDRWGIDQSDGHVTVWFEIRLRSPDR